MQKRRATELEAREGNDDTCDPQANGQSTYWFRCAGADELNVKGRPRNRPLLSNELFK